ncbi:uncharacterized protein LOC129578768 [Sitodiplosis mosellana]|uniref:uncharacterized protein LOC129578768 n=1 Tax=Sitodiplosis mosellana TaxID=263140 RepID=UPI0024449CC8|nr:uncharacterized protein LOC129578768 [Sitodiplosis mosellana]XP_055323825.1 uncharacterized protein LOC129578768 [Sitodiplosis mosellana]
MVHQFNSRDDTIRVPKHLQGSQDVRVILAEFILNFDFPRDFYSILITGLLIYLTLKLFRFSIHLLISLIRPIIFVALTLIALPYLYEMKSGVASNRVVSNVSAATEGVFQSIYETLNSIYMHTIQFYAKNF